MADATPVPVKGSGKSSNSQKLLVAVLATLLVVVGLVFAVPVLLGDDDAGSPSRTPNRSTASSIPPTTTTVAPIAPEPIARPGRNPFVP